MRNLGLKLFVIILIIINYVFNACLCVLAITLVYSLIHLVWGHQYNGYDHIFLFAGFGSVTILLLVGIADFPFITKWITQSRLPLNREEEKLTQLLLELSTLVDISCVKQIYLTDNILPNLSGFGLNTVIVERVLVDNFPQDEIKALLIHAIILLQSKQSFILLTLFWINLPLTFLIWVYRQYAKLTLAIVNGINNILVKIIALIPIIILLPIIIFYLIANLVLGVTYSLLIRIFTYSADYMVVKYGCGNSLINFLQKQRLFDEPGGFWMRIYPTYLNVNKRIYRLEQNMKKVAA